MPGFISDEVEWTLVPDLVVMDVAYVYTGLRDKNGHKILRRVSRRVGFTADNSKPEYVVEPNDREEPDAIDPAVDESQDVEGE